MNAITRKRQQELRLSKMIQPLVSERIWVEYWEPDNVRRIRQLHERQTVLFRLSKQIEETNRKG